MVAAPEAASATDISPGLAWPAAARKSPRPQEYAAGSGRLASRSVQASVYPRSNPVAGRAQSRRQNHARPEGARIVDCGGDGARPNDADSVDALQSLARLICAMLHNDPPLDRANHRMQRLELSCQYDQAGTRVDVERRIGEDEIELAGRRVRIVIVAVDVTAVADVTFQAVDGEVQTTEAAGLAFQRREWRARRRGSSYAPTRTAPIARTCRPNRTLDR